MTSDQATELLAKVLGTKNSYESSMEILAKLIDAREPCIGYHSFCVKELSLILGKAMGLGDEDLTILAQGSLLHDIGKLSLPESILLKRGKLNCEERKLMQTHAQEGWEILKSNPQLRRASEIAYSHHEKYDGTGYPHGLKGDDIPLNSRIFAVIDAYDAMRADRIYQPAISAEEAVEEIKRCSGTHFDPYVVEVFLTVQPEIEKIGEKCWQRKKVSDPC